MPVPRGPCSSLVGRSSVLFPPLSRRSRSFSSLVRVLVAQRSSSVLVLGLMLVERARRSFSSLMLVLVAQRSCSSSVLVLGAFSLSVLLLGAHARRACSSLVLVARRSCP